MDEFIVWYCSEPRLSLNKAVVTRYRIHLQSRQLAPGTVNGRLAAVRRLAYEAADSGLLSPDLAAGLRRVKGPNKLGVRPGNGSASTRPKSENLAPHYLRLTCARLCRVAEGELDQIQFLSGQVAVQTTERYPGCKQRLKNAVNDRIGIEFNS